ncbi:hypothetical protein NMG60_11003505 [Bertholletia excelsa]
MSQLEVSAIIPSAEEDDSLKAENMQMAEVMSLLELPELALECILQQLSPAGLCIMAGVCRSLRDMCMSDHLWERRMKPKWGRLIGEAAYREWHWYIASKKRSTLLKGTRQKPYFGYFSNLWPPSWNRSKWGANSEPRSSLPENSIMALYLALESGQFRFPAQVYNRENGHIGFMLSCYDAEISYDSSTDTFRARYSTHGRQTIEENIVWDRIRAPVVDTPAYVLHASTCLNDLKPGDHIEIQWRRNRDFPYGWWYGVVGHLESCDKNIYHCHCQSSGTVILEFKQYNPGSQWRQIAISRKDHREVGNMADGFYGGIRKLYNNDEILVWKSLWPTQVLDSV